MTDPTDPNAYRTPAVQGWAYGRPDFEANPRWDVRTKQGTYGVPGEYAKMLHAWSRAKAEWMKWIRAVRALPLETTPYEDERSEETRFNEAVEDLWDRIQVEQGDGIRTGGGWYLGEAATSYGYGFSLIYPRWLTGRGLYAGDTVRLTPLLQAAVYQFDTGGTEAQQADPLVLYQHYNGSDDPRPLSHFLHTVCDGGPGEYMGRSVLRPLLAAWLAYQRSTLQWDSALNATRPTLKIYGGGGSATDPEVQSQRAAAEELGYQWGTGKPYVVIPDGKSGDLDVEIAGVSGAVPDFSARLDDINGQVDDLFGSQHLALGRTEVGSRAAGEVMERDSASAHSDLAHEIVNLGWGTFARWVAGQEGYRGRIRAASVRDEESRDPQARATTLVSLFGPAPLGKLTKDDVGAEREAFGLAPLEETADDEGATDRLQVGSLVAAVDIIKAIRPVDPTSPPLAPAAAVQLLVAAGVDIDAARAMVQEQAKGGTPAPTAEPTPQPTPRTFAATEPGRVIVIAGPPASGKSSFAAQVAREHAGPVTTISADRHLYDGDAFQWSPEASRLAHEAMSAELADAMARGDSLVTVDAPLGSSARRARLASAIRDAGYVAELVIMGAPVADLVTRNKTRPPERRVPEGALRAIAERFGSVDDAEGWDTVERPAAARLDACECGDCVQLAAKPANEFTVKGADGREIANWRPPLEVEVRGVKLYPESWVPWATDIDAREARKARFRSDLDTSLDLLRTDLADDLRAGGDGDEVRRAHTATIRETVEDHFERTRADVAESRAVETGAQRSTGVTAPGMTLDEWAASVGDDRIKRHQLSVSAIVAAIVAKVSSEVVEWFTVTGGRGAGFSPQRRIDNYVREVFPAESAVEAGDLGDIKPPFAGAVIAAVVRLSTKQPTVCPPCRGEDGRVFVFPDDLTEFVGYRDLPDTECTSTAKAGKSLCECRWSIVWGHPDE